MNKMIANLTLLALGILVPRISAAETLSPPELRLGGIIIESNFRSALVENSNSGEQAVLGSGDSLRDIGFSSLHIREVKTKSVVLTGADGRSIELWADLGAASSEQVAKPAREGKVEASQDVQRAWRSEFDAAFGALPD